MESARVATPAARRKGTTRRAIAIRRQPFTIDPVHTSNLSSAESTNLSNAGLYVHLPFCETKCGYCDFYSVPLEGRATAPVVERVRRELAARLADRTVQVKTVFFGGGTPTLLPIAELAELLTTVRQLVDVPALDEFTVEANPATVEDAKATLLVSLGVTRVSMGAQSFFPSELAALERLHSPEDIPSSVATLRRNGVGQINLDLIFGIPGQTLSTWGESLRRAMDLGPNHIACYGLTFEPGTRLTAQLRSGRVTACDENLEADLFLAAIDTLEAAGYRQYEISNFAQPSCESKHNLVYWRNEPYVAVGPSAAGCVGGRRYKNVPDIAAYIRMMDEQGHAEIESEVIEGEKLAMEMILMQLRLNEGLSVAAFRTRTGVDPRSAFGAALDRWVAQGYLVVSDTSIALTRAGRLVANRVITDLASELCPIPSRSLPVIR